MRGDAGTGGLDLLAEVIGAIGSRLHTAFRLLHTGSGYAVDFLSLRGDGGNDALTLGDGVLCKRLSARSSLRTCNFFHNLLCGGGGLGSQLLSFAPHGIRLLSNHVASLAARARCAQKRRDCTDKTACQKNSEFVAHNGLLQDVFSMRSL